MEQIEKIFFIHNDMHGVFVKLPKTIYEKDAVLQASYKFVNQCYVRIDALEDGYVGVWFKNKKEENNVDFLEIVLHEFCNEVLDQQVRLDLEKRYGDLRERIYQHAFKPVVGGVPNES